MTKKESKNLKELENIAEVIRKYSYKVNAPYPNDHVFYYLTTENQLKKRNIDIKDIINKYFYIGSAIKRSYVTKYFYVASPSSPYEISVLGQGEELLDLISKKSTSPCLEVIIFMNDCSVVEITDEGIYVNEYDKLEFGKFILKRILKDDKKDLKWIGKELDKMIENPSYRRKSSESLYTIKRFVYALYEGFLISYLSSCE
jgi:hypothetical protein